MARVSQGPTGSQRSDQGKGTSVPLLCFEHWQPLWSYLGLDYFNHWHRTELTSAGLSGTGVSASILPPTSWAWIGLLPAPPPPVLPHLPLPIQSFLSPIPPNPKLLPATWQGMYPPIEFLQPGQRPSAHPCWPCCWCLHLSGCHKVPYETFVMATSWLPLLVGDWHWPRIWSVSKREWSLFIPPMQFLWVSPSALLPADLNNTSEPSAEQLNNFYSLEISQLSLGRNFIMWLWQKAKTLKAKDKTKK